MVVLKCKGRLLFAFGRVAAKVGALQMFAMMKCMIHIDLEEMFALR